MSRAHDLQDIKLLKEEIRRDKLNKGIRTFNSLYPWQVKFINATKDHDACMLMASNQCFAGDTPIRVTVGKDIVTVPFLEALSLPDARVRYWADGSLHDTDNYRAFFQGILPTFRLYLSNGHHLDCSGGHRVLDAGGNYRTILSLMSDADVLHCSQIGEDFQASYVEDDCLDDQQLRLRLGIDQALLPLLGDVQLHTLQAFLRKDEAERIDPHILACLKHDLLSNQDALNHAGDLYDRFSCRTFVPSEILKSRLLQASSRLMLEEVSLSSNGEAYFRNTYGYGESYSNHIVFPKPIPLMKESIIAWQAIGLQPLFDYQIPDYHNCITSGIVSHNSGKTRTGTLIDAFHLTGDYPEDWDGHKFTAPPMCWLLGYSGEKTRDLLQYKLFGRYMDGKFEGGVIPSHLIVDHIAMTGTSGAMREVRVKHVNGIATCQFWSYSQGQHALMGDVVEWYHIDEEPKDATIYPQVLTRTINGDQGHGGRGILTFTPENGKTMLVCQFMGEDYEGEDEEKIDITGMYLQGATWKECPHITPEKAAKMLAKYPKYQRRMRSEGIPLMGSGLIYEIDEDEISTKQFEIPEYWFVINGMDFGWDHPQAITQMVWNKETDQFYFINAWKARKKHPFEAWHIVKPWCQNVPVAWPGDGLQHKEQSSGESVKMKELYEAEGFNMLPEHATFEDGGNGVWVGIMEIINLMRTGRFKVVSSLFEVFEEIRQYHTKTVATGQEDAGKTKIVKVKDDLIDSMRYAYMMRRYAVRICDLYLEPSVYQVPKRTGRDKGMGY